MRFSAYFSLGDFLCHSICLFIFKFRLNTKSALFLLFLLLTFVYNPHCGWFPEMFRNRQVYIIILCLPKLSKQRPVTGRQMCRGKLPSGNHPSRRVSWHASYPLGSLAATGCCHTNGQRQADCRYRHPSIMHCLYTQSTVISLSHTSPFFSEIKMKKKT